MELATCNKLFSFGCILLLFCVPFLNGASLPLEEKHQDENNSTNKEFSSPESSKNEQSVNHQIAAETTERGNVEHSDEQSIILDGNTTSTTSQPFQTIEKNSVSKPTQGTTPIPPFIDIDDDQYTKIVTKISKDYSTTTTAPPPLENKLDKEALQPTGFQHDDENVTTTPKTFGGKTDDSTFNVNVTTTSSPEPVVNNLSTKDDQGDHNKLDFSSQRSKAPDQKETNANTNTSITQGENENSVDNQNATVNIDELTNGNNESRSSTPSEVQNDAVPENLTNKDIEKAMLSNKDNETLSLDDLDEIISKRHYYTSNDFNGNTSDDNINLDTKARDITEPTPSEIQTSSQPATADNASEHSEGDITTESENTSTIGILKEEITTDTPSTPKSLPNITITEKSTAATTTPVSTSSTTTTISSSPPSTNTTQMPPSDKPENNSPVHQFFMDLRAHTVLCLISLLLLLLAGTIIFSFVLAIIYAIKYSFIGIVKLFRGLRRCCPKRKKSSNGGFHESGSLFPRCDVSIRPYDPSNPNDRDMY